MIFDTVTPSIPEFERRAGWSIKPQGACRDDRCVPLPPMPAGLVDLRQFAERLRMPLVHEEIGGLWCLGPEAGGQALSSAEAPDLTLPDVHGREFHLASLRGMKVLLIAWASW